MRNHNALSRSYPQRPYLAASIAVLRDGKFLLISRSKPPYEDHFSLPGGVVETGESLQEAAARELMEEVGIEATVPVFIGPVEIIDKDKNGHILNHAVVMVHAAFWKAGEAKTGPEARQIVWVEIEQVDALRTTPSLKNILIRCQNTLAKGHFPSAHTPNEV